MFNIKEYNNRKWLIEQYIEQKKSSLEIAADCGVCKTTILRKLKSFNIPRRSISEARKGKCIGEKNWRWNGGIFNRSDGYIMISKPEHHRADSKGYVFEHILIAEKKYNRPIDKKERIHHINMIKGDNREENLYVCKDNSEHQSLHQKTNKLIKKLLDEKIVTFKDGNYHLNIKNGK